MAGIRRLLTILSILGPSRSALSTCSFSLPPETVGRHCSSVALASSSWYSDTCSDARRRAFSSSGVKLPQGREDIFMASAAAGKQAAL